MGWYMVRLTYDRARIPEVRPAHRRYLHGLAAEGIVGFAGFYSDESAGLFLYRADGPEELAPLIDGDPYWTEGAATDREVRPFDPALLPGGH